MEKLQYFHLQIRLYAGVSMLCCTYVKWNSMVDVVVNIRFLDLMWVLLHLLNYLRKWRSCKMQFWSRTQSCKMGRLQMCLQQKDIQMTLRRKLIPTSNKCSLVSWPLKRWFKCLLGSRNLQLKGTVFLLPFGHEFLVFKEILFHFVNASMINFHNFSCLMMLEDSTLAESTTVYLGTLFLFSVMYK